MKKALLLLLLPLIIGCTSDDDSMNPELNDQWVLNNVICFCGFGEDFDFSTHTLQFDAEAGMVVIGNNAESHFIAAPGTYPYTDNGAVIGIGDNQYTYEIDGDSLVLTYVDEPLIADDEITYYYTKN